MPPAAGRRLCSRRGRPWYSLAGRLDATWRAASPPRRGCARRSASRPRWASGFVRSTPAFLSSTSGGSEQPPREHPQVRLHGRLALLAHPVGDGDAAGQAGGVGVDVVLVVEVGDVGPLHAVVGVDGVARAVVLAHELAVGLLEQRGGDRRARPRRARAPSRSNSANIVCRKMVVRMSLEPRHQQVRLAAPGRRCAPPGSRRAAPRCRSRRSRPGTSCSGSWGTAGPSSPGGCAGRGRTRGPGSTCRRGSPGSS